MKGRMFYAAAAAVGLAGVTHLYLALTLLRTSFMQFGEFFVIVAVVQLFWVIPTLKKFGRPWLFIGIGGNLALFALWLLTRMPNPITRIGLPINTIGITEETFQLVYVALAVSLVYVIHKGTPSKKREETPKA
ncbi:MAG: hypothetical protein KGI25_10110 [Thaumarchaeota archaeon]|nr:hypothetical protein [Nitrososphaerota archaeon]